MNFDDSLELSDSMKGIERLIGEKKREYINRYVESGYLATLIIGVRLSEDEPWRESNLKFLLQWLEFHYEDAFDILLVEQDAVRRVSEMLLANHQNVRYEFLYNNKDFNRGWGYNVAVKYFCDDSKVVALMDTDVLPGPNFLGEIRDCYVGKFDVISPYRNIYYTEENEVAEIKASYSLSSLTDPSRLKNPVTITGGVVIFNRRLYMDINGFEQYIGYGCEDRALDVTILTLFDESRVRVAPYVYAHLWHPTDKKARTNWNAIYTHLQDNYGCKWHRELGPNDYIHSKCDHHSKEHILTALISKAKSFGKMDLYSSEYQLGANGVIIEKPKASIDSIVIPPEFVDLDTYEKNETYKAPAPDSADISTFYNAFLGERCFIIGNGPSLNKHDLSLLENEYSFGVNSFYYKTRECGFRPFFYVVEDSSVMKENITEIRDYYAPFKFFPTIYKNLHPKDPNTFFFTMNRGFYEKSSPNFAIPRFSTDASKELYCGQSVTYINLQLAYFMGFSEIYLIGMDFDYVIPESHARKGDVLYSDTDDVNHFHKDYFGKGKSWKDPKLDRVASNYKMAKLVYECGGRKIYNATVGGKLEIFDRVNYNSLFASASEESNKDRKKLSFPEIIRLQRDKKYDLALEELLFLSESNPDLFLYKEAVFTCIFHAKKDGFEVHDDLFTRALSVAKSCS